MGNTLSKRHSNPEIINGKLYGQDYVTLKNEHLRNGTLFTDSEFFPPDKYSICYNGKFDEGGLNLDYEVKWVRAREFWPKGEFIINGPSKDDINQGLLGDCWFLASMAVLAERRDLFDVVVPGGQDIKYGQYCGMFLFRFFKWGQWVEVVVDDYIPIYWDKEAKQERPLFTYSDDEGEMWPCLLEKAFAKLHGSYTHLVSGFTVAALECLTGGFTERFVGYDGPCYPLKRGGIDTELFDRITDVLDEGGLVCTGTLIDNLNVGIFGGHAYSITGTYTIPEIDKRLVKIRNPWGTEFEWIGRWSDDSKEMMAMKGTKYEKALENGVGEFWMEWKDFLKYFTLVEFCVILNDWRQFTEYHGSWSQQSSSVKFCLTMMKKDEVFLSLEQKYSRELRDELNTFETEIPIGINLYKVPTSLTSDNKLDLHKLSRKHRVHFGNNADFKELTSITFHDCLDAGTYLVDCYRDEKPKLKREFFFVAASLNESHKMAVNLQ